MPPFIVGNWKMNPATRAEACALAKAVCDGAGDGADLLICPPFTALGAVAEVLRGSRVLLGAQDCHAAPAGPHTGDISPAMLADLGVTHVILGHSERRATHAETDDMVRHKARAALDAGLIPIVCVGETADQRASGRETEIVGWQLEGSLPPHFDGLVAYEPIWAIGTGRTPSRDEVATMHAFITEELIRQFPAMRRRQILYGGSVNAANAGTILALPHVAGALVGGASLLARSFLQIGQALALHQATR